VAEPFIVIFVHACGAGGRTTTRFVMSSEEMQRGKSCTPTPVRVVTGSALCAGGRSISATRIDRSKRTSSLGARRSAGGTGRSPPFYPHNSGNVRCWPDAAPLISGEPFAHTLSAAVELRFAPEE